MERYIGKMLDNRYEILEVIGTGGMAVVFKAKCHRLNRLVAVKMLKKNLSDDAEFRRRFHDESQAVAMLSHPNIMAVYDVSRGGDMDYIVMELIDGITLKQYMERRGRLNWPEALHFITQIMKGLSHAHSRGIIHRDIKPQNIMVLRDGTVKVTDFGIACLSNGNQPSNEAIGSVHYISPEQAKGEYTDNRSDIYSAGVVLYEMITSRLPFNGSDPVSVAIQHFSSIPLSPSEINPDVPAALEQICLKAMAPDRKKRYLTADEMLQDLEEFRKDPSVSFDYSAEDLQEKKAADDEPTQHIPNVSATKAKKEKKKGRKVVEEDDDDDDDYYDRRPRSNWFLVLLMIILIGAFGYYAVTDMYESIMSSFQTVETPEYVVPDLVGKTLEEARKMEEISGIFTIVEIGEGKYSAEFPAGQIMEQTPAEGTKKKSNLEISVTVSLGVRSGAMPYLIGEDFRNARLLLNQDALGKLKLQVVEGEPEYHDTIPEGHVIRTSPIANEPLEEGDEIVLIVSMGPEIIYHPIPYCVSLDMEKVQQMMTELNMVAEFTAVDGSQPEGTVLSQSVPTGEEVPEGTVVSFTYSNGAKEIQRDIQLMIPHQEGVVQVEVYLDDMMMFGSDLNGDYGMLELSLFKPTGSYSLRFYVNDELVEERVIEFSE